MRPFAAPRIDPVLVRTVQRAPRDQSAADVTRFVGTLAGALGLPRPSYQQVRVLLKAARSEPQRVSDLDVLLDILIWRSRPAYDLPNRWYGDPLPFRPGARNEPRTPTL